MLPVQVEETTGPNSGPHRVLLTKMHFEGLQEPLTVGLDTMAAINVLPKSMARALNVLSAKTPSRLQLQGVGKSTSEGVVLAALRVTDDAPWEPTAFEVIAGELPTPVQALLSFTWLERHQADLSLRPNQHAVSLVPCRTTA